MKLNHIIVAGLALLPLFLDAATPTSTRNDGLLRQELSQERIGTSLQRVARQLDSVIAEYDRNGLEGDDVDTLKRFRGMLNNLTQSEVHKIVKQLENARLIQKDNTKASTNAFGAFAGGQEVGQVVAGAEGFAGPQDQHRAHVIAVAGEGQQVNQVAVHGAGQGVEFVRAVQGQGEHRAVFGRQHLTALQRG